MTEPAPDRDRLRADLASLRIEREPVVRRARRGRRIGRLLLLVLVAGGAAGWWVFAQRPVPVRVEKATVASPAELGPAPVLSGSGYVVTGDRYISLGVRVPGRIDRYFVEEGQSVRAGDPLVQLDDRDYRATVEQTRARIAMARANLALAESELKRGRALWSEALVSRQEVDVLENRAAVERSTVEQLEAELRQAQVNLEYTLLRAPTDGVVLAKLKEVGEIAVPGGFAGSGDLVRLANLNDMRAEVDVNEADLARVKLGQAARVTPDAFPASNYPATVAKLYPQVDRQKGTLKIEVKILAPDEKLLPDMSARVTFLSEPTPNDGGAKAVVLAPLSAVRRDERGDSFVWVVDGRAVRKVRVETEEGSVGDHVRIASGLAGGESLVVGDVELRNGQKVQAGA
jgi:RND family efflux transporter MFP subunit